MRSRDKFRASDTTEARARQTAYFEALGEFVDMFSRAELSVRFALWHYAKVTNKVARAVFSGVHVDTAIGFIRRVLDARGISEADRKGIGEVLTQLKAIADARNDILHLGAQSVDIGEGVVSNALIAHNELKTFPISDQILREMTNDLRKITLHLALDHMGRRPVSPSTRSAFAPILRDSWQYKHEPQRRDLSKRRASDPPKPARTPRPKQIHPREPSQA